MRQAASDMGRLDVTVEADIQAAVEHIKAKKGRFDILINNAGWSIP